jgi:hypothetical protein
MKTELLKRLRAYFVHGMAPAHTARHNIRAWVHARRLVADKWLYAAPMGRKSA